MDIGSWVPQFFYDLIGRLAPGGMFVGAVLVIFPGSGTFVRQSGVFTIGEKESATLVILAVITVAYISGAVLGGIGYFSSALVRKLSKFAQEVIGRPKARLGKSASVSYKKAGDMQVGKGEESYSYRYDFIHFHCPRAGARLAKIGAERHMCRVVIVGAVLLLISLAAGAPGLTTEIVRAALAVALLGAWALNRHLDKRGKRGVLNNWRLINDALQAESKARQIEDKPLKLAERQLSQGERLER